MFLDQLGLFHLVYWQVIKATSRLTQSSSVQEDLMQKLRRWAVAELAGDQSNVLCLLCSVIALHEEIMRITMRWEDIRVSPVISYPTLAQILEVNSQLLLRSWRHPFELLCGSLCNMETSEVFRSVGFSLSLLIDTWISILKTKESQPGVAAALPVSYEAKNVE